MPARRVTTPPPLQRITTCNNDTACQGAALRRVEMCTTNELGIPTRNPRNRVPKGRGVPSYYKTVPKSLKQVQVEVCCHSWVSVPLPGV